MSIEFPEPRSRCASAAADAERQSSREAEEPMTQTTFAVGPVTCYHMAAAMRPCAGGEHSHRRYGHDTAMAAARMLAYCADSIRTMSY